MNPTRVVVERNIRSVMVGRYYLQPIEDEIRQRRLVIAYTWVL